MKRNIDCPCGRKFSIDTEEEIDLDQNSEYLEKINNGKFMIYACPDCGKIHKPEYQIILLWKSKNIELEVLPEIERGEFYRGKKEDVSRETVIGYPEMAERIAVIQDNLEPVVIETLKYYLLVKAEENYPDKEINARYFGKNSFIEFHLDGIRDDEVAVMKVPQQVYKKACEDYRKHPKKDIYTSLRLRSYLSVNNIFKPGLYK